MASEERTELNYWPSFVDIFASLFFIFLILFAVYFAKEGIAKVNIEKDMNELAALINQRRDLIELDENNMNFVIRESVLFAFDKAELNESGIRVAMDLGELFGDYMSKEDRLKKYSIIVEGHTDSKGEHIHNNELSLKRANSLIDTMMMSMKNRIPKAELESLLIPVGYGERKLKVAPGVDNNKCADNRRVEIKLIPKFNDAVTEAWKRAKNKFTISE